MQWLEQASRQWLGVGDAALLVEPDQEQFLKRVPCFRSNQGGGEFSPLRQRPQARFDLRRRALVLQTQGGGEANRKFYETTSGQEWVCCRIASRLIRS